MQHYKLSDETCFTKNQIDNLLEVNIIRFDSDDIVYKITGQASHIFLSLFEENLPIENVKENLVKLKYDPLKIENFLKSFFNDLLQRKIITNT